MNKLKAIKPAQTTNKGFTLVEILLAISILGIVVTMFTGMIIHSFNIVGPSSQRMSAKQMAELNLRVLARYARNAEEIYAENNIIHLINDKEIKHEDNNIIKENEILVNNIVYFNVENIDSNGESKTYKITIGKCKMNECDNSDEDDWIKVSTTVQIRN